MPRTLPNAHTLLPIVRRLMSTGTGPPGLADWAARYGFVRGQPDDSTARRLADRLAEEVARGLAGGAFRSSRDTLPVRRLVGSA